MSKKTIQKIIALVIVFMVLSACGFTSLLNRAAQQVKEIQSAVEKAIEPTATPPVLSQELPKPSFEPETDANQSQNTVTSDKRKNNQKQTQTESGPQDRKTRN